MFDFFKAKKEETALLVDIGNGTITVAFAVFSHGKQPRFIYSIDKTFPVVEKLNAGRLLTSMSTILDSLLAIAMKDGLKVEYWKNKNKKIDNVLVALSSPWFVSKTKKINLSKDVPFLITKNFISDILGKEEVMFQKELEKSTGSADLFQTIEKSIVHTKINGYSLENSIGNKTKSFDAFLCMSSVNKSLKDSIVNLISKHTHIGQVIIHTFPLVLFSTVRDMNTSDSDFLLVDITSEVIDITFVKDEVVVGTATLPSGRNFIIRQICKKFDFSPEIAESTLRMYIAGKADDEITEIMKDVVINVEKEWAVYFDNALSELGNNNILPGKAYVTGSSDVVDLGLNFLKIPMDNIVHLNKEKLSHLVTSDFKVKVDEFIAILGIFYNKLKNLQ